MIKYISKTSSSRLGGTVLLRLDFNTEDEWRMRATLPTIRYLLKFSSKIIIVSHRGRPEGMDHKFSLRKDGKNLGKMLRKSIRFVSEFDFVDIKRQVFEAPRGTIFLLENLRFLPGEEKNDLKLAARLGSLADYYVNDAFAVSHRNDASVEAVTRFLPAYAGLELESELNHLSQVMNKPKQPLVIILGGGKAHDKLPVIKYFRAKADAFILGGAVANAILREKGVDIKKSDTDKEPGQIERQVSGYKNIFLPVDFIWEKERILDIGKKSEIIFSRKIESAKTIIWNGPLGLIEKKNFSHGTKSIIQAIARNKKAFRLAGGGETVMYIKKQSYDRHFSFISTGGGAMLEFLSGKKLPGIEALKRNR